MSELTNILFTTDVTSIKECHRKCMTFHISSISSETTEPIGTNLCRNDVCEVFYKDSSLLDLAKNMAAMGNF
jgi:predicted TIM-barrel enzyme